MNHTSKIITVLFYLSSAIVLCSDQPNQLRRLPSYDGIQEGGFEGCSDLHAKILHQGNCTLDNYGEKGMHHGTEKEIRLSSRQQHPHCNWHCYTRILTDYVNREITADDHRRAAQLYCILIKNADDVRTKNGIDNNDLIYLSTCAAWGATDAIRKYKIKKYKVETNTLSWLDSDYWLLPSVEALKENVYQEIAKIPVEIIPVYMTQCPQTGGHLVGDFLREEQKAQAEKERKIQEAAENDRIEQEYCIVDSQADILSALTEWKDNPSSTSTTALQKICKEFNNGNLLMKIIQEYSEGNFLSDRQISTLLVETDLVHAVLGSPHAYPYFKNHYNSRLVADIIAKK